MKNINETKQQFKNEYVGYFMGYGHTAIHNIEYLLFAQINEKEKIACGQMHKIEYFFFHGIKIRAKSGAGLQKRNEFYFTTVKEQRATRKMNCRRRRQWKRYSKK